jgi:hypothetical protein
MAAWIVLTLLISGDLTVSQPATFTHIRSEDRRVRDLIATGYTRSTMFKTLVDAVEKSPCVVYVATVVKLSQGRTGALLHLAAGRPELPVLRVLLKASLSPEETIATVGHELQHVVEVSAGVPAGGGIDFTAGIDASNRKADVRHFETDAAIAAAGRIREELRRTRP